MADKMADASARMGEATDKAKEMASTYASKAKEYAAQGYEYAADKSRKVKESAQGYIEDNPWYAVGIALGVGVLLGMLLRGGSRDE